MAGGNPASVTPSSFAVSLLGAIGAPVTHANVNSLVNWQAMEGGNWKNTAAYNPLNTTLNAPGARSINGVGVKAYGGWQQGLNATAQTLRGGGYGDILAALHAGNGLVGHLSGLLRWSGNGYSSVSPGGNAPITGGILPGSPTSAPGAATAVSSAPQPATPSRASLLSGYLNQTASNLAGTGISPDTRQIGLLAAAQGHLQALAGGTVLNAHPALVQATAHVSNIAGGFLPAGARYTVGRKDQGRDGQTAPGGAIVAPGNGYVVRIGSDPGGFGPAYPIVHFISGPYAGRTMYLGHTLAAVQSGTFRAGQVLSHTGTSPVGNASVPGWFEIGFADGGSPGPMGQKVPF